MTQLPYTALLPASGRAHLFLTLQSWIRRSFAAQDIETQLSGKWSKPDCATTSTHRCNAVKISQRMRTFPIWLGRLQLYPVPQNRLDTTKGRHQGSRYFTAQRLSRNGGIEL